jgi:hypothetical protein
MLAAAADGFFGRTRISTYAGSKSRLGPTSRRRYQLFPLSRPSIIRPAQPDTDPNHVPATPYAAADGNLIARADRALRDYVAARSIGDDEAIVTSDAVVEYALEEPGTYLVVEAAALSAKRSGNAKQAGAGASIWDLYT